MVIEISIAIGLVFDYSGLNAVKMLFWSAILNGLLAPPLVVIVVAPHERQKSDGSLCQFHGNEDTRVDLRHRHERGGGRAVGYFPLGVALLVLGLIRRGLRCDRWGGNFLVPVCRI